MTDSAAPALSQHELLDTLDHGAYLEAREAADRLLVARAAIDRLPFYLKFIAGIGALIGSVMFIGFLAAVDIIDLDSAGAMLAWGIALAVAGVFLHRAIAGEDGTIAQSFALQASFLLTVTGKGLLVIGVATLLDSPWAASGAFVAATVLTFRVYPVDFERFLSAYGTAISVILNILWLGDVDRALRPLAIDAFFVATLAGAAWLSCHRAAGHWLAPIRYAALATLATIVGMIEFRDGIGWLRTDPHVEWLMSGGLVAALIGLVAWTARDRDAVGSPRMLAAYAFLAVLGAVSAPGVLLGIGYLVLGHARRDAVLVPAGGAFLAVFLFVYYYSLDLTLAAKSGVLFASGAVLLVAYAVVRALGWDRGPHASPAPASPQPAIAPTETPSCEG